MTTEDPLLSTSSDKPKHSHVFHLSHEDIDSDSDPAAAAADQETVENQVKSGEQKQFLSPGYPSRFKGPTVSNYSFAGKKRSANEAKDCLKHFVGDDLTTCDRLSIKRVERKNPAKT